MVGNHIHNFVDPVTGVHTWHIYVFEALLTEVIKINREPDTIIWSPIWQSLSGDKTS